MFARLCLHRDLARFKLLQHGWLPLDGVLVEHGPVRRTYHDGSKKADGPDVESVLEVLLHESPNKPDEGAHYDDNLVDAL